MTWAGRPASVLGRTLRLGGILAIVGAIVGGLLALWLQSSIFPSVRWLVWIDLVFVALAVTGASLVLRLGGRLVAHGERVEVAVRTAAIRALAEHRNDALTARDVAKALDLHEPVADAALTALALADEASVDVDDARGVVYRIGPPRLPAGDDRSRD